MLNVTNYISIVLLVLFLALYMARFRGVDVNRFSPPAAWVRACIFFCACWIICWLTGTQTMIVETPVVTSAQLQNGAWIAWTIGLFMMILIGYWGVWARYTMRFDRKLHLLTQIPFGLLWGVSMGQLILIMWRTVSGIGALWPGWLIVVVTLVTVASIFWVWMVFYWDLYIAPEHDSKYSIALKTIVLHIPQSLMCVIYVTLYHNFVILIALQTLALVGAAIFMRMPSPWSQVSTPPARRHPFIFGLVYAGGYVSSDPKNDPCLKAAHLPY